MYLCASRVLPLLLGRPLRVGRRSGLLEDPSAQAESHLAIPYCGDTPTSIPEYTNQVRRQVCTSAVVVHGLDYEFNGSTRELEQNTAARHPIPRDSY